MLSLAYSKETTWSSIDITSAFLNADIHDDDTVLVTPPTTNSCQDGYCQAQYSVACQKGNLWSTRSTTPIEKSQQGIVVYHGITSNQRHGGNLVQWRSS